MSAPDALCADAGALYDALAQIVDLYDDGHLNDRVVTHNHQRVWLIDELARELVNRHDDRKVQS